MKLHSGSCLIGDPQSFENCAVCYTDNASEDYPMKIGYAVMQEYWPNFLQFEGSN